VNRHGRNKRSLAVMRTVGIIGAGGQPTALWTALRSKDGAAFAAGLRKHYADLFATYPDANRKDDESLVSFVRSKTTYADQAQRLAVRTFKILCEFGDFSTEAAGKTPREEDEDEQEDHAPDTSRRRRKREHAADTEARIALTVNLQLQLPASEDGEVYDKLFAAMSKHLKGLIGTE
jgi:hypothetical protein